MAASNTKNNSPRKLTWTSPWRQQAQQAENQEPPPPPPADIAQSVNEEEQLADNATAGFVEESIHRSMRLLRINSIELLIIILHFNQIECQSNYKVKYVD